MKPAKEMTVTLTLIDEALGMMPANPEVHETYIASKAPDAKTIEEEVAAVGAAETTRQATQSKGIEQRGKVMRSNGEAENGEAMIWR